MAWQDFLQSASNEAAGTVSMPVDAIAWLLKKAGVPVGTPVGGSDWMEQRGLTRPVQQSAASLAGQTAGLLSPVVAAAKAPQIAKGLLQMGDNLAAPTERGMLAGQRGAIVYHGSPHKFDKFDSSKIGTGEGAQAYGHGLYLAESPDVANGYAKTLSNIGADGYATAHLNAQTQVQRFNNDPEWALEILTDTLSRAEPYQQKAIQSTIDMIKSGAYKQPLANTGSLYKVDLPDEKIARMLDWDSSVTDQKTVNDALSKFDLHARSESTRGKDLYDRLVDMLGSQGAASDAMRKAGIPGIRYLDGGSRGAGAGTSNYVVFPGEEDALKILERNGQGLLR